jgi:NAD(P)-dependent dehydrogenase (short-subunit alcohol dehydrogenase family)
VSIADSDLEAGLETVRLLRAEGAKALFVPTDVSLANEVEHWIEETVRELSCPGLLVNSAGIGRRAPFLELRAEDFDRVVAVNLRGTFLCSQSVARRMVERGSGGAIITIASTRAFMSEPGTEAYTASKGGIVSLTHAMAVSLGPHHIRVNCISPGWIETRDWQYSKRQERPLHSERDRLQHPVGRVGRPEDIAEACLFLAESAGFITGQNLIVDGGMTVKMIYEE